MADIVPATGPTLSPKELFAELLADGWTILEIREQMGLTDYAAQNLMREIRADLGVPGRD